MSVKAADAKAFCHSTTMNDFIFILLHRPDGAFGDVAVAPQVPPIVLQVSDNITPPLHFLAASQNYFFYL